jgi:hypothetical protein
MAKFLIVALEGDVRDRLGEIVRACGKEPRGPVEFFTDWGSVAPYVGQKGYLVAGCSGDWTVLIDDGSVTGAVFDDVSLGEWLATRHATRVASAYGHSVSDVYGFRLHSANGTRAVLVQEEKVIENEGDPVPGEDPEDVAKHNEYSVMDVLGLWGIDIADGVESCSKSALLRFADSTP